MVIHFRCSLLQVGKGTIYQKKMKCFSNGEYVSIFNYLKLCISGLSLKTHLLLFTLKMNLNLQRDEVFSGLV